MIKSASLSGKLLASVISYLTPALLFFYALSLATKRWQYTISHLFGQQKFSAIVFVAATAFIILHRKRIQELLKKNIAKGLFITCILCFAAYHRVSITEFFILAYMLSAVLYFKSFNASVLSRIINNESRTPAVFALLCIIAIPFLLIMKKSGTAEQVAVYAYYFLVITVLLKIFEMKLGVERKNELLELLQDHYRSGRKACVSMPRTLWQGAKQLMTAGTIRKTASFLTALVVIVAAQSIYWNRLIKNIDQQPIYQYKITLLDPKQEHVEFAPIVDEVTVPLRITHPLSIPRLWPTSGPNPVMVGLLWFEQGNISHANHDALFEDRFPLDKSLSVNESEEVQLKLKRPLLPGGRSYDVQIDLVHEGIRWFSRENNSPVTLNVELQSSRGVMPLTREMQVRKNALSKLADAWSEHLSMAQKNYRSKIELISKADSLTLSRIKVSVMNMGKLPWPSAGKNPIGIGILWIQKIKENSRVIYRHIGEEHIPLTDPLFPGKREIANIAFDPFKYPAADEIWVAMVHEGYFWFHDTGDDVLKLMDKRAMPARELVRIQAESISALRETQLLENDTHKLLNKINDNSIPDENKYRSRILLKDEPARNTLEVVAGEVLDFDLSITNAGSVAWPIGKEKPVTIGILWFKKGSDPSSYRQKIAEERCFLPFVLQGGTAATVDCKLLPKLAPGQYDVSVGLVHEGVDWFFARGDSVLQLQVTVRDAGSLAGTDK